MTREEAVALLERYSNYDGMGIPNLAGCKEAMKVAADALKEVYPELAESENERIRKELIETINCMKEDHQVFLSEQQIERYLDWLEKQKENPKSADSIPSNYTSVEKCEDRDSEYGVFPEDALVVARACEKLEAHGYLELAHALINVNLYTKEQKQEWSEEDEKMRNLAIEWAETMSGQFSFVDMDPTDFRKIATWLKSLKPSWKPSEEQMDRLFSIVAALRKDYCDDMADFLASLYKQLKKL